MTFKNKNIMSSTFIVKLIEEINNGIPGEESHAKMSPIKRPISDLLKESSKIKESAVALILYRNEREIECILIQRPEYDGNHSGQISFPGGKKDSEDIHLEFTARRETFEEIGIPPSMGQLIGQLTEVYIPISNFLVQPIIYYHEKLPKLVRDTREVAEIFSFSLSELLNEECFSTMKVKLLSENNGTIVPCFLLGGKKIWGATAIILNEFRELLLKVYK
jgi:8-oxo-dGTP pyrophosphatase MutT (NUDIX family)